MIWSTSPVTLSKECKFISRGSQILACGSSLDLGFLKSSEPSFFDSSLKKNLFRLHDWELLCTIHWKCYTHMHMCVHTCTHTCKAQPCIHDSTVQYNFFSVHDPICSLLQPVVDRIMVHKNCPCPNPQDLWICYSTWQKEFCRYD